MLYAADLLHNFKGWSGSDREIFKGWWRENCLVHTYEVMIRKDNNWKDAGILGVMAASVVLEDRDLMVDALTELKSYYIERYDSNVKFNGLWKIKKDANGVYLPREVIRVGGQKGITYTAYALNTMVQALEIAGYAGFDLWHNETNQGVTVEDVIEWYFRWNILEQDFPWNEDPNMADKRFNSYELANFHYSVMPEMKSWLRENRPVTGREGDEYITLNKGDLPPARTMK